MAVEIGPPGDALEQGDILNTVPSVYVRSSAYMVRLEANKYALRRVKPDQLDVQNRINQENVREIVLELDEGEHDLPADEGEDRIGNAVGARRMGLVLSHGCELDKQPEFPMVTMVLVRPLAGVEAGRESIVSYEQKRAFYLPAGDYLQEPHYADFRYVTSLRREVVDELPRIGSMNEEGRDLLNFQYFRFHARRRLPDDWATWPVEREEGDE